jgi:hypothetical protein
MDDAVAVFAPTGEMTLSNAAYARLWGIEDGERDLSGELVRWDRAIEATATWAELRDAMDALRAHAADGLRLPDGRILAFRLSPLPRGARLVSFQDRIRPGPLATAAE